MIYSMFGLLWFSSSQFTWTASFLLFSHFLRHYSVFCSSLPFSWKFYRCVVWNIPLFGRGLLSEICLRRLRKFGRRNSNGFLVYSFQKLKGDKFREIYSRVNWSEFCNSTRIMKNPSENEYVTKLFQCFS